MDSRYFSDILRLSVYTDARTSSLVMMTSFYTYDPFRVRWRSACERERARGVEGEAISFGYGVDGGVLSRKVKIRERKERNEEGAGEEEETK